MFKIEVVLPSIGVIMSIYVYYYYVLNCSRGGEPMANTGLLFVSNFTKALKTVLEASKYVQKVLYIKVNEPLETNLFLYSKQMSHIYTKSTLHCPDLDVRLIFKTALNIMTTHPIDLVLYDNALSGQIDKLKRTVVNLNIEHKLQSIDAQDTFHELTEGSIKRYEYVALGGTFDRLHNGHKILLSEAVLRTTKQLTVGVTDLPMIQHKKLWELIQPVEDRIKFVFNFLNEIYPGIEYNVVPINDMYGPTKDDPNIQLLVLSEETVRGGVKVNEKRKENNLSILDTHVIDLAPDTQMSPEEEPKVSSSNIRMRLLGTVLRAPQPNPNILDWPYVVGLAGGIASGKSKIAEILRSKGASIINCDTLAHELYQPGLPLNVTIAETFGKHLIDENGDVDRKALGQIVFGDKNELEKLNSIMWPAIAEETKRRIRALGDSGCKVVVMEAAVMVRAKWDAHCHQLWSVIIPPEEAIKRLQKRNGLSEDAARDRINSQPSNSEQIARAHVVFSPYWSYDYTKSQVERAWDNLQEYLRLRK